MATFEENRLLSSLNGPYNRIAHLVEEKECKISRYSVTQQEHEYLRDFLSLSKSKKMIRVRKCNSKHLSKRVIKIAEQLVKLPVKD
ncbi:hypothetical protein GW765_01345 [Candidatus Parcubacteria bacterium]|nr:hypothetical protein [Candidatus Parcubacteria bacterium]